MGINCLLIFLILSSITAIGQVKPGDIIFEAGGSFSSKKDHRNIRSGINGAEYRYSDYLTNLDLDLEAKLSIHKNILFGIKVRKSEYNSESYTTRILPFDNVPGIDIIYSDTLVEKTYNQRIRTVDNSNEISNSNSFIAYPSISLFSRVSHRIFLMNSIRIGVGRTNYSYNYIGFTDYSSNKYSTKYTNLNGLFSTQILFLISKDLFISLNPISFGIQKVKNLPGSLSKRTFSSSISFNPISLSILFNINNND